MIIENCRKIRLGRSALAPTLLLLLLLPVRPDIILPHPRIIYPSERWDEEVTTVPTGLLRHPVFEEKSTANAETVQNTLLS